MTANWHVVTDDGCGPLQALVDSTATSTWSKATEATVTTDMPGTAGNCVELDSGDDTTPEAENESETSTRMRRALVKMGLVTKRAKNVNKSFVSSSSAGTRTYQQANLFLVIQSCHSRRNHLLWNR